MARLPSPRHPVHCSLWIPGLREGDDSPLRTSFRRAAPATYPTRQLPTPRSPPCGLNGTSQIPLPRCAEGSSQLSLPAYHAAHAAVRQSPNAQVAVCNAVVLARISHTKEAHRGPESAKVVLRERLLTGSRMNPDADRV